MTKEESDNKFIGPGKLFETEEEEFAEKISYLEWATQVSPEKVQRFRVALARELQRRQGNKQ
jgi:hypothetical protein